MFTRFLNQQPKYFHKQVLESNKKLIAGFPHMNIFHDTRGTC